MIVFWILNWSKSVPVVYLCRLDYLVNLHYCHEKSYILAWKPVIDNALWEFILEWTFTTCYTLKPFQCACGLKRTNSRCRMTATILLWSMITSNCKKAFEHLESVTSPGLLLNHHLELFFYSVSVLFIYLEQQSWNWEFSFYAFCIEYV